MKVLDVYSFKYEFKRHINEFWFFKPPISEGVGGRLLMENYQETSFRDRPSTFGKDGKRVVLFPKLPKGKLYNYRRIIAWVLLIFVYLAPFMKFRGEPLIFLNFLERKFVLFGNTFYPQDFHLLVIALITMVVFIVLFTVIYGRYRNSRKTVCGQTHPQKIRP